MLTTFLFILAAGASEPANSQAECTGIGEHYEATLQYICDGARGWAESIASGDTEAVERILADDFVGVDTGGEQYLKSEMLEDVETGPKYFKSNQIGNVVVRFYGEVAVAQGSETWEQHNGNRGRFVWTDTWLKRDGNWQIIAAQDVNVPE